MAHTGKLYAPKRIVIFYHGDGWEALAELSITKNGTINAVMVVVLKFHRDIIFTHVTEQKSWQNHFDAHQGPQPRIQYRG